MADRRLSERNVRTAQDDSTMSEVVLGAVIGAAAGLGGAGIVAYVSFRMAQAQRVADRSHLDIQLRHDREMRDLQHLRETLRPIVARALDWDAFTEFHLKLAQLAAQYPGQVPEETWNDVVAALAKTVGTVSEAVRRDSRALMIVMGSEASVVQHLRGVADNGGAMVKLARRWKESRPALLEQEMARIGVEYGHSHARLMEAAKEVGGWGAAASAPASS